MVGTALEVSETLLDVVAVPLEVAGDVETEPETAVPDELAL